MQLSKLEIKGFKSFGDKVVVNFNDGITGIVGPNGCGKSNIVDAMRWVLGEQKTRALRSDKMENVIFNGTKTRKAGQMAEVSLTFNNTKNLLPTAYSQVTITRRYYRSGESEYLLNGVNCRLKDINNLFLDTGIGPDSYAIIELKMVDEILNDKDNSRRNLFEEAAGISKFKQRKKETLRKLEDTDKDLQRVEDVLYEIEKNLRSLERQAKQAEKYKILKEEYKKFSIALAKINLTSQREKINSLQKQLQEENDRKTSSVRQTAQMEAELEKQKADLVHKENLLASRQKTLNEYINKIRQFESDKKIRNERLRYLTDKELTLKDQLTADKNALEALQIDVRTLEEGKYSVEKIISELEYTLKQLQEEVDEQKGLTISLQEELTVFNNAHRNEQEALFQFKKSLEVSEIQLANLKKELEKTGSDTTQYNETIAENDEILQELAGKLDDQQKALDQLIHVNTEFESRIEETIKAIDSTKEELALVNREIDSKENEYNLTKSLVDNLEGFPEAIKFLKKNSRWGHDAPLLSDILTCDEKYRVAIENYLEPLMNYYVVEDFSQAYQAVKLLSESAKGKANFFVLSSLEQSDAKAPEPITNCLPAIDIVEFDPRYKKLIQHVLHNVYVITHENENAPEGRDEIFIAQSGKLTKRPFSLTGGSVGLFEGKRIGRAKNLEKLQERLKTLNAKKDKIEVELDRKQNELSKYRSSLKKEAIEAAKKEITQTQEVYLSTRLKQEQLTSVLSNNITRREDIEKNIKILENAISNNQPKLELKQVEINNLIDRMEQVNETLKIEQEVLTQKNSAYNQQNINFHQHKNKIESIEQEVRYKQNAFESAKQRIERNQEELSKVDLEIKKMREHSDGNDEELLGMYEEKEAIEQGVNEAEKAYYSARGEIDNVDKSIREVQRNRESSDGLIMNLQNTLNETKLSLASVQERLKVEFDVNINQLILGQDSEEIKEEDQLSKEELERNVDQCRHKLNQVGPINPMAVEAYEEIKERYDFIVQQKKDLSEAKKSLLSTISEIDEVARENFTVAFNSIRENFIKVFRSLFTEEDKCDLKLTDPSNPLDSEIEISAKPKGKKPLTINQLSGGEKTLTAVALLFAIYLIKPAPFCIFDEVDAPLDDANIDKFNNIIRTFSKDSQFILVTHNKRTMSTTDVIYGVTMQEPGVSRLIPVDLRTLE